MAVHLDCIQPLNFPEVEAAEVRRDCSRRLASAEERPMGTAAGAARSEVAEAAEELVLGSIDAVAAEDVRIAAGIAAGEMQQSAAAAAVAARGTVRKLHDAFSHSSSKHIARISSPVKNHGKVNIYLLEPSVGILRSQFQMRLFQRVPDCPPAGHRQEVLLRTRNTSRPVGDSW
jgi:hypothetical protein